MMLLHNGLTTGSTVHASPTCKYSVCEHRDISNEYYQKYQGEFLYHGKLQLVV